MKFKIKFLRGEVFATPFIYIPFGVIPNGMIFLYQNKEYKIIDCVYLARDEGEKNIINDNDKEVLPVLTVVEL